MKNFLMFRTMLMPILLQIVFWIGSLIIIVIAINNAIHHEWILAIITLIAGLFIIRIFCEWLIIVFQMNKNLEEINEKLGKQ